MTDLNPRYFRISPKFWSDPVVEGWDDDTRLLALYILTCPQRSTEGLFSFKKKYALADLGWVSERLEQPFKQLLADGFIEYDEKAHVLLIVKALKQQSPENPNQAKHAVRKLLELPPTPLTSTFRTLAEQFAERLVEQLPEGFGKGYGKPQALTQAQSQALTPPPSRGGGVDNSKPKPKPDINRIALELVHEFDHPEDLTEPIRELERRLAVGEDFTSPVQWVRKRALTGKAEREKREAAEARGRTEMIECVDCNRMFRGKPGEDERCAGCAEIKAVTA